MRQRPGRLRGAQIAGCLLLAAAALAACGGSKGAAPNTKNTSTTATSMTPTSTMPSAASFQQYVKDGPYAAGTMSMTLHGDPIVVWYPAPVSSAAGKSKHVYRITQFLPATIDQFIPSTFPDATTEDAYTGLPMAGGQFPIVLFAHGYTGFPDQSTFLTAHLATWGFIVVAPELTSMDVSQAVSGTIPNLSSPSAQAKLLTQNVSQEEAALHYVSSLSTTSGSFFDGHVVAGEAGIVGHSEGGATAVNTAAVDPTIKVVVSLAGVPTKPLTRAIPTLFMTGSRDKEVPTTDVQKFYGKFLPGKSLVVIDNTGHNVFDDLCTINHLHGGIPGAITELHLPVPKSLADSATDGCNAPDIYPPKVWPLINESVTAELLWAFGQNKTLVGLGAGIDNVFSGLTAQYSGDLGSVS